MRRPQFPLAGRVDPMHISPVLRIVALVAVLLSSLGPRPEWSASSASSVSALDTDAAQAGESPCTARTAPISAPRATRLAAATEAPPAIAERPSQRHVDARPPWRRLHRLRSDDTRDH